MMSDDSIQELHRVWAEVAQMRRDIEILKERKTILLEQADELKTMSEEVKEQGIEMSEKLKAVSEALENGMPENIEWDGKGSE